MTNDHPAPTPPTATDRPAPGRTASGRSGGTAPGRSGGTASGGTGRTAFGGSGGAGAGEGRRAAVGSGGFGGATPADVDALRADLRGFTVDALAGMLGDVAHRALAREQVLPALLVTRRHRGEPLATLMAAFVLGDTVDERHLDAALPSLTADGAERIGLVQRDGDTIRAAVELRPYAVVDDAGTAEWWLVSDLGDTRTGAPLRPDHVLGVGGASMTLARSTIRAEVARVLDVGVGCGVQSVHAARHARHVTATDTSHRALRMTRLNWELNRGTLQGVPIDLRHGSLLEPVAGERYDLVVSNPPFVISPRASAEPTLEYRDAGFVGDSLVQRLLSGVHDVLAPGGVAQMLGNWEIHDGEDWTDRITGWLAGTDLDAWVIQREVQDPAEYVEVWMRDAGQHTAPGADELYATWLADFEARGVEAVGFGLVTLRRPRGPRPTLRRLEERRTGPDLPPGHELARALEAHDWLTSRTDDDLLAATPRVAADVTEERHHRPGEEEPAAILLRQGGGAGRVVQVSTAVAGAVGACDGTLGLGLIAGALAQLLEREEAEVRAEILPAVRGLITDGLLEV